MVCVRKHSFFIIFSVIVQLEYVNNTASTISNKIQTLRRILQMDSWQQLPIKDVSTNISSQKLFIDGQLIMFSKILNNTPIIDENSLNKITSVMYVALGCKCSESIKTLLQQIIKSTVTISLDDLRIINTIVLKTISVLLHLIDIAPNIIFQETGVLYMFLHLNVQIHNLIYTNMPDPPLNQTIDKILRLKKMINEIEHFTIFNCSLDEIGVGKTNSDKNENFVTDSDYINSILDKTGLQTKIILKYTSEKNNEIFTTIIIQVVKSLKPILNIEQLLKQIEQFKSDIDKIFSYMNLIFDSIMKIIYEFILKTFQLLEKFKNKNKTKCITKTNYLINTNLITIYKYIISQSILMKFPMIFIKNIKLVLKIIIDMGLYKNINHLMIIKKTIDQNLNYIQYKYQYDLTLLQKNNKFKLIFHEFLKVITSTNEFKYFNLILSAQQNYHIYDIFFDKDLNKIDNSKIDNSKIDNSKIDNNDNKLLCETMRLFYKHCLNILSENKHCNSETKCLSNVKKKFSKATEEFNNNLNKETEIAKIFIPLIDKYSICIELNYADTKEKLYRILLYIMNFINKYEMHNCTETSISLINENKQQIKKKKVTVINLSKKKFTEKDITGKISYTLIKKYISSFSNQLYHPKFYWKGELKTINEISNYVGENLFNFSSFKIYVNLFHKWFISILMCTIIDVLKCFSQKSYMMDNDKTLVAYIKELPSINFPEPYLSIINTISVVDNFYQPINIIGFQISLEEYLEEFDVIIQKTDPLDDISVYMKHLDNIIYRMKEMYTEENEYPSTIRKAFGSRLKLKKSKSKTNDIFMKIPDYKEFKNLLQFP